METNKGTQKKISELIQLMFVGLIGANKEIENRIKSFHARKRLKSNKIFFFYEFLTHQPLPIIEGWETDDVWFFAPFIQRLAKKTLVGLDPLFPDRKKFCFLTEDNIVKAQVIIPFNESIYMKPVYDWCVIGRDRRSKKKTPVKGEPTTIEPIEFEDRDDLKHIFLGNIEGYTTNTIEKYLKEKGNYVNFENMRGKEKVTWKSKTIEYGFIKPLIGHIKNTKKIPAFIIPIASSRLFYGEILVWLPLITRQEDRTELGKIIASTVKDRYVSTLAILHEHFLEKISDSQNFQSPTRIFISDDIPANEQPEYRNPFFWNDWGPSNDKIENSLHALWEKRVNKKVNIDESFVFKSYLIASPMMINLLKNILKIAPQLKMVKTSLPSVLIVGGPGSGKDAIAGFLRVFTENYSTGMSYVINMAAVKPDALIAPSIMGGELTLIRRKGGTKQSYDNIRLSGILNKIRDKTIDVLVKNGGIFAQIKNGKFEGSEEDIDVAKKKRPMAPIFILDELNSMDIDSQGVLLRFLENAEIVPISGIEDNLLSGRDPVNRKYMKKAFTDFLVIGVMNEDPDELSRDKALEFVRKEGYISGLLGDLLYEYFLKMRRLRPDLKYRIMRSGKFKIPELDDRREDIPILFHVYTVLTELPEFFPDAKVPQVFVTLDGLELLMAPELHWPGNIRQLQALAKITAEISYEDYIKEKETEDNKETQYNNDILLITESHIREAMEQLNLIERTINQK